MSRRPRVAILGAGPAGLGAAFQLTRLGLAEVTVLERNAVVGGNAGSFELAGMQVDYGSHRLHPACDAAVLADIRNMLGEDLLDRPRHGRIRLCGRWIHFPLKPLDLALRLPPRFAAGVLQDSVTRPFRSPSGSSGTDTFATVLEHGLGRTICRDFYFPYARKLWGVEPGELSGTQARRRVSGATVTKLLRKVAAAVPGLKGKGAGRFYYPRGGYGRISEAYRDAAQRAGARFVFNARVDSIQRRDAHITSVEYALADERERLEADFVWSTIPITVLAGSLQPPPPPGVLESARNIGYRAMILIYLVLDQDQFTEYDAHYFPQDDIRISRLSEPKNYSATGQPRGRTVLCAELPCAPADPEWSMSDAELGDLARSALHTAGLPVTAPVSHVVTRRLRQAYPIYLKGYEAPLNALDDWIGAIPGLLTFGRQGLFAHDNTHHALYMAYAAADCLTRDGRFDSARWKAYRRTFETHVVED
jgi:protoporphyrinogen oxidase